MRGEQIFGSGQFGDLFRRAENHLNESTAHKKFELPRARYSVYDIEMAACHAEQAIVEIKCEKLLELNLVYKYLMAV